MNITKNIQELLEAKIISKEIAENILEYYRKKRKAQTPNRLFIVFGILGSILVGLGIILIIAHNWDELSRPVKTFFAFLPLIVGQLACGYSLTKKADSTAWRESSATFLVFAVGACISLVSQIYNIPGNLSSYLLTWILLCLPLIYVMNSSLTSLLYLIGITYYAGEVSYWSYPISESYLYWLLLLIALPHYYFLFRKKPDSNFLFFHNWFIPLSVIITLGTVANNFEELMYVAYFSLFGLLYIIGNSKFFSQQKLINNAYLILGSLGTLVLLLMLSFEWFWEDLQKSYLTFNTAITSPELLVSAILSLSACILLYLLGKNKSIFDINPFEVVFILFIITFLIGFKSLIAIVIINILVFGIGLLTIKDGAKKDHLGILNFGLLIITALIICRFFDTDLSFITRGILFISVGIGFFVANYYTLKKRKQNE